MAGGDRKEIQPRLGLRIMPIPGRKRRRSRPGRSSSPVFRTISPGRSRALPLDHLLAEARRRGYRRVSLETGSMDAFAAGRSLYRGAGFSVCDPFGDYRASPNSVYVTVTIPRAAG